MQSLILCSFLLITLIIATASSSPTISKTQISGRDMRDTPGSTEHVNTSATHGKNKAQQPEFTEIELERLCPPGKLDILKSIHKSKAECNSSHLDYWFQKCLCHYSKQIHCPECPGKSIPNPLLAPSGTSHYILGSKSSNSTVLYQIPVFKTIANGTEDFGTANKFNIYNTAGGIINLYFYQTGQQQIVAPGLSVPGSKVPVTANKTNTTPATTTTTTTHAPMNLEGNKAEI